MPNYSNHDTNALFDLLNSMALETASAIKTMAEILMELHTRGESHPFMKTGVLHWYAAIATGKASPYAALAFGGVPRIMKKILPLDLSVQEGLARGEPVPVAEVDTLNNVIRTEKVITRLSSAELDRVFDGKKIRTHDEQARFVRKSNAPLAPIEKSARIRVDLKTGKLLFGMMKVGPDELREPLRALGYRIVKVKTDETV